MIEIYINTQKDNILKITDKIEMGCWINLANPTEDEINMIISKTGASKQLLLSALDENETSHLDMEDGQAFVLINLPYVKLNKKGKYYATIPLGILVLQNSFVITISKEKLDVLSLLEKRKSVIGNVETYIPQHLVFQLMYVAATECLSNLTIICKDAEVFEETLSKNMKSSQLLKLVNYEKSMIFLSMALKNNHAVIEKLKLGKKIPLTDKDLDILEDAEIENIQATELASTYGEILKEMTDIFGTVASNNVNTSMKLLTSLTLIISIPTLIASIMGMNVIFPFDTGVNGFYVIMCIILIVSVFVTILLNKKDMLK